MGGKLLGNEEDRAMALLLGSILEQGLETIISTHFQSMIEKEQIEFFNPASGEPMSFDLKIRLGNALGAFGPDSRDDLVIIKNIRNLFAHSKTPINFNDQVITDMCDHMKFIDKIHWGGIMSFRPTTNFQIYIEAALHFYVYFTIGSTKGVPIRYIDYQLSDLYA
jgi:hypothetical protein